MPEREELKVIEVIDDLRVHRSYGIVLGEVSDELGGLVANDPKPPSDVGSDTQAGQAAKPKIRCFPTKPNTPSLRIRTIFVEQRKSDRD